MISFPLYSSPHFCSIHTIDECNSIFLRNFIHYIIHFCNFRYCCCFCCNSSELKWGKHLFFHLSYHHVVASNRDREREKLKWILMDAWRIKLEKIHNEEVLLNVGCLACVLRSKLELIDLGSKWKKIEIIQAWNFYVTKKWARLDVKI